MAELKKEASESSSTPTHSYAGFWRRFLAYSVDSIIVSIISFSIGASFSLGSRGGFIWFPGVLITAAYFIFFWMKEGQTLGNRLMAIKVIREDGKPMDVSTGIIRYIGYILSSLVFYLGFLWVIWDKKKQGWHDKIAGTLVVKTEAKPKTGIAIAIVAAVLLFFFVMGIILALGAWAVFNAMKDSKGNLKNFRNEYKYEQQFQEPTPTISSSTDSI